MSSTFTTRARLEKQSDGENDTTWGQKANLVFDLIDEWRGGYLSKSVAGGADVTLTANSGTSDESRQMVVEFTGALSANINVIVPTAENMWIFKNSTTGVFTLTIKTAAGTGETLAQGKEAVFVCDGTNVFKVLDAPTMEGLGTLATLSSVDTAQIASNAVTSAKIATDAVTSTQIAPNAVTSPKIAASAVTSTQIAVNAVTTAQIAAGAVTYTKVQDISATQRLLGRNTTGAGVVEEVTWAQFMEWLTSSAQGDILYRNASSWTRLPAGIAGQFFKTNGPGADPEWANNAATFSAKFTSAAQGIPNPGSSLTVAHGLGARPFGIELSLRCAVTQFGYSAGDEVSISLSQIPGVNTSGYSTFADATNVTIYTGSDTSVPFGVVGKGDGVFSYIDKNKWQLIIKAWI